MAGIDNNTLLYLRGDSFNDLSLSPKTIISGGTVISNNAYYINSNKLPIKVDGVNFRDTWTIDFFAHKNGNISTAILSKGYYTAGVNGGFTLRIINPSEGRNGLEFWTSNGTTTSSPFQNTGIYFNDTFDHYAFTYDGTKMNIFINGKFIKSFTFSFNFNQNNSPLIIGGDRYDVSSSSMCIKHFRLSNTVLYTQDFTPPTKAYSSIDINISNKDSNKIDFNISKLGKEVINKIEVLVNSQVFKTYDNIGDLTYDIDKSLLFNGNNKIKIKVTFDNDYTEEKEIDYEYVINNLSTSSSLKELIDRQELLTNIIEVQKNNLKSILESKNVEVSDSENKLSILIDKVNSLVENPVLNLFNENGINNKFPITPTSLIDEWAKEKGTVTEYFSGFEENKIVMRGKANASSVRAFYYLTSNKIDLTQYKKIFIDCLSYASATSSTSIILTVSDVNNSTEKPIATNRLQSSANETRKTINLDISNLTGEYYVGCLLNINTGVYQNVKQEVYRIWLEK